MHSKPTDTMFRQIECLTFECITNTQVTVVWMLYEQSNGLMSNIVALDSDYITNKSPCGVYSLSFKVAIPRTCVL